MPRSLSWCGVFAVVLGGCVGVKVSDSGSAGDTGTTNDCGPTEIPYDGLDNDCNVYTKDDDLDGDGYPLATDCDDEQAATSPDATETPYDGVDNDCNEATPDDDLDGDGFLNAIDCDDTDALVNPEATETCDGVDDDCDGTVDVNAADGTAWYADVDGDGYGDVTASESACAQPSGYVADATDCADGDAAISPLGIETCNGLDDNCDGATDETGCTGGYGGHRVDHAGDYYYALYNDKGFGIMGSKDWYGDSDSASGPEGVT